MAVIVPDRHEEWARNPVPAHARQVREDDLCPVCGDKVVEDPDEFRGMCSAECEADELARRLALAVKGFREIARELDELVRDLDQHRSALHEVQRWFDWSESWTLEDRIHRSTAFADVRLEAGIISGRLMAWRDEAKRLAEEVDLP
ncbi:MAG: hypothetical protein QJR08_03860 [Bacillota bacterium]|nr:hypothetical protein [Bacillota bacterium]